MSRRRKRRSRTRKKRRRWTRRRRERKLEEGNGRTNRVNRGKIASGDRKGKGIDGEGEKVEAKEE